MSTIGKKCTVCGVEIPAGRIKAVPNTRTCVQHSQTDRYVGTVVSIGNPEAGDSFQEFDIVRTEEGKRKLHHYQSQLGSYRN